MSDRVVCAIVVVVAMLVTAGTATAVEQPTRQVDVDADSTQLNVHVQPDGDATWEVVYRIRLDDENDTEAFEQLRQDVQNNSTAYTDRFGQRMDRIAADAENATGREMEIRNVTVETRSQVDYGFLVYRFEWTNFAAVEGDTVRVGDAIDQFYLDSSTSLRVSWPDGYSNDSVTPAATRSDGQSVWWDGELDFGPGEPRVVVVLDGETPVGTPTETATTTPTPAAGAGLGDSGSLPFLLGLVLVAMVAAGGAWLYARRNDGDSPVGTDGDEGGAAGAATAGSATTADDDAASDGPAEGPPPELLSNEERVLRLLEQNSGRMKQKQVAEQLDWTAAKTSQVVGDLRDDEKLDSFRLGRENVLTLPDVELEPGTSGDNET